MKLYLLILIFMTSFSWGKEKSRPQAQGYDNIIELNIGSEVEHERWFKEFGVDYERFIEGYNHHLSIGAVFDYTDKHHDAFFVGPLVSYYYHHFKGFASVGVLQEDRKQFLQTKFGLGYEIFLPSKHDIIIPTLAYGFAGDMKFYSLTIGFGHEF